MVLRLAGWGGFRPFVVRILTCLIYDRLKAQRDRFEPQIAVLRQPEAPLQLTSVPDPPVYPDPDRFTRASAQAVPQVGIFRFLGESGPSDRSGESRSVRVRSLTRAGCTRRARTTSQAGEAERGRRRRPGERPAR